MASSTLWVVMYCCRTRLTRCILLVSVRWRLLAQQSPVIVVLLVMSPHQMSHWKILVVWRAHVCISQHSMLYTKSMLLVNPRLFCHPL